MSTELTAREAPASYVLDVGRTSARHVGLQPDLRAIPQGYKQTEMGVIPEDWEIKLLQNVCHFRGGKAHEQYISELGQYVCVNSKFISTDGQIRKYSTHNFCPAHRNDILMVMSDLPNGKALAKAYLVEQEGMYAVNQRVCALTAYRDNPDYLFYVLNRNPYFLQFDNGVSQTHLLNNVFLNCQLPIPPTQAEQEAIAEALSDADALIESLEQLIAKKRHLKQGAMQELLTDKKRLPGFGGEWEIKRIGEFTDCTAGGTPSTGVPEYWNGSIRWMNSGELNLKRVGEVEGRITDEGLRNSSTKLIPANCVLIGLAGQGKTRGTVAMNLVPLCINQSIAAIFPNESFDSDYLYYNLDARYDELRGLSAGDGGRGGLNLTIIRSLEVSFPSLLEQTAIAAILSDMDAEIAALEARLAKARGVKQGMMQELLTGRIRLV